MTSDQLKKLEATLWQKADTLLANSDLKASEYSTLVLGLIFLKFADNKYKSKEKEILEKFNKQKGTRKTYRPDCHRNLRILPSPQSQV